MVVTVSGMSTAADVSYRWFEAPVREGLQVTQVYGYLICPSTGRVLIQDDEGVFNLPGGTPETWDSGLSATLSREAMEESQVRIDNAVYLGFQEVRRPGRAPYAQVRMACGSPASSAVGRILMGAVCIGGCCARWLGRRTYLAGVSLRSPRPGRLPGSRSANGT